MSFDNIPLVNTVARILMRRKDFKDVFGTVAGKRVLKDLYNFCGANEQIHTNGDPYTTAFKAGKHRVMQHISSILNQSDDEIRRISRMTDNNKG